MLTGVIQTRGSITEQEIEASSETDVLGAGFLSHMPCANADWDLFVFKVGKLVAPLPGLTDFLGYLGHLSGVRFLGPDQGTCQASKQGVG